jgi:SAM-dependent methyltransferase
MQKGLIKALNQLNHDFYAQISEDFSETRNFAWQGWEKVFKYLPQKQNLQVLDIACGNGRFVEFLEKKLKNNFTYLGLDNSQELLKIAKNKFPKQRFEFFDLVENYLKNKEIIIENKKKIDLIVLFGISHHLPSFALRNELLKSIKNNLNTNGLIVISNWQFAQEQRRFAKNILDWKKIAENSKINLWQKIKLIFFLLNLETGDYLLDWRKGKKADQVFRYCHQINAEEMQKIATENHLQVIDRFFADGKSDKLNQYFLLKAL